MLEQFSENVLSGISLNVSIQLVQCNDLECVRVWIVPFEEASVRMVLMPAREITRYINILTAIHDHG